jgi:hypothetical protein
MGSKYNRRRKVQPTPEFCYAKKPGRLDILPYQDGPAIGPNPYVLIEGYHNFFPPVTQQLFDGRLQFEGIGSDAWTANIDGSQGNVILVTLRWNPKDNTYYYVITPQGSAWPPFTFSTPVFKYRGGRQLDTRVDQFITNGFAGPQPCTVQAYL